MYPSLNQRFPASRIRELVASNTPGWTANNPSIARGDGCYRFTVRSSNFVLDPTGLWHQSLEPDVIRTKNYIGTMDDDLRITDLHVIEVPDGLDIYPPIQGMEDARLFWTQGRWHVSGTFRLADGTPTIAIDTLSEHKGHTYVTDRRVCDGPDPGNPQKNWLPLPVGDMYAYGSDFLYGPWNVGDVQLRGSSQAIPQPGGWLGVLHFVTWPGRMYWHCFATWNWEKELVGLSAPFYFMDPGVEFCNGLTQWQGNYIASFGYREARCFLAYVPVNDVLGACGPIRAVPRLELS